MTTSEKSGDGDGATRGGRQAHVQRLREYAQKRAVETPPSKLEDDPVRAAMTEIGMAISRDKLATAQALLDHHLADRSGDGLQQRYPMAIKELRRRLVQAQARRARNEPSENPEELP